MNKTGFVLVVLFCALTAGGCMSEQYMQHGRRHGAGSDTLRALTNHDIVALTKAGIGDSVIIPLMQVSPTAFKIRPEDIVALADSGVSDNVIAAMIKPGPPEEGRMSGAGVYYYPPYYWYPAYAYWDPWYPSFYLGYSYGYDRPFYGHYWYGSSHWYSGGHGGPWRGGSGSVRSSARHR